MSKIITAKNITKSFEKTDRSLGNFFAPTKTTKTAVDQISIEIEEGEFVGFLGPNGAGKTTFLKILSGIIYPSSGEATVLGFVPWQKKHEYLRQISLVMGQKNQLWWDLPAIDSFNLLKEIYSIPDKTYKQNLDKMVDLLNMGNVVNHRLRNMSLGERMKCELTACFLHNPKVVFLDEPTIGLDVVSARAIRIFLKQINKENGCTIILTSHYMADIEELCQRIFIINKGKKVYDGDIKELLSKFSSEKIVQVVLNDVSDRQKFSRLNHKKSLIDGDGVIRCSNSQIATVAKDLFELFPAENIAINNVDIEEVITKIYKA